MQKSKRVAFYLRVSTDTQTTQNQLTQLEQAAQHKNWDIVRIYQDAAVSGTKGRDTRPQFNLLIKDAVRGQFDLIAAWSVDRLGRSLQDLTSFLNEIHEAGVDLFLYKQALDTSTPSGRMMFGMISVFAEFEAAMIRERVMAGLDRARKDGKVLGRPKIPQGKVVAIKECLARGNSIRTVCKNVGVGSGTVQRVKKEIAEIEKPDNYLV